MKRYNRSWRIVFFGFILITLSQCGSNAPKLPKHYPEYHTTRLKKAFSSWGVRLSVEPSSSRRTKNDNSYYPSHWVGLTDETCNEAGYDNCRFQRIDPNGNLGTVSAVGHCILKYSSSIGEILSATMLIHKGYQEHPAPSEEEKQIVYTHELGHCLGLRHTDDFLGDRALRKPYIMYGFVTKRSTIPHTDELDVIKYSYGENEPREPLGVTPGRRSRSDYFARHQYYPSLPLWHRSLPVFYYYDPTSPSPTLTVKQDDSGRKSDEDLDEDLMTIIFNYYSDGSTMVEKETHNNDGSTVVEKETHNNDGSTMVEKETRKSDGSIVVEKETHKKH